MMSTGSNERVAGLERQVRRLQLCLFGLVGALLLALLSPHARAAGVPTEVTAQRFVLHDREGRERAVLGFDSLGTPRLTFFGPDGEKTFSLSGRAEPYPVR